MHQVLSDIGKDRVLRRVINTTAQSLHDRKRPVRPHPYVIACLSHRLGHTHEQLIEKVRGLPIKEAQALIDGLTTIPDPTEQSLSRYRGDQDHDLTLSWNWYVEEMLERVRDDDPTPASAD